MPTVRAVASVMGEAGVAAPQGGDSVLGLDVSVLELELADACCDRFGPPIPRVRPLRPRDPGWPGGCAVLQILVGV